MKFILGKKINMTQIWEGDKVVSVTKVVAGPCIICQVKDMKTDKYKSLQLAFGTRKPKNISKPVRLHMKKAGILGENAQFLREFRVDEIKPEMKMGSIIDVSTFSKGDVIDVTGVSKGKGFQGVVKRHHFSGSKKTHGNKDQLRASGSIGALGPSHVFKGVRMGGRMGGDCTTIKNLEVVSIDLENNFIYIKGGIPGAESGLILIKGLGDLIIKDAKNSSVSEVEKETPTVVTEEVISEEVKTENTPTIIEEVKTEESPKIEGVVSEEIKAEEAPLAVEALKTDEEVKTEEAKTEEAK